MTREAALLLRFRRDADASAMEDFVRATRPRLLAVARRIGSPQDAEDSAQAAYHAILRREGEPPEDDPVAWLVVAVVRIAYRRKAVERREREIAERLTKPRDDDAAPRRAVRDEEAALVRAAVHRLPAIYRDVVILHHLEGLPLADVAKLLDVPVATAKTRVQRGRALLRAPLGPLVAHGFLFVHWKAADLLRALTPSGAAIGGAMQTKWVVAAAFALLAAGAAIGVVIRTPTSNVPMETAVAKPASPVTPRPMPPAPRRRVEEPMAAPIVEPARTAPRDSASPAPPAPPRPDPTKLTQAAIEAAATLGVPDDALHAAWAAYQAVRWGPADGASAEEKEGHRRRRADALAALSACGDAAFPAVVALMKGGEQGTYFEQLVAATASRGRERLLIELADDRKGPFWVDMTALGCLGFTDTPEVREYLLARLEEFKDAPYPFSIVAGALGRLREPRGFALCRERVRPRDEKWNADWELFRGSIVHYLARMDRDAGARLLVELARDPTFDLAASAVRALGQEIDVTLAKTEATALVASGRVDAMSVNDARTIRAWAAAK